MSSAALDPRVRGSPRALSALSDVTGYLQNHAEKSRTSSVPLMVHSHRFTDKIETSPALTTMS